MAENTVNQKELPPDLAQLLDWSRSLIETIWYLRDVQPVNVLIERRKRLIDLTIDAPVIPASLASELIAASCAIPAPPTALDPSVHSSHALEAVRQTGLLASTVLIKKCLKDVLGDCSWSREAEKYSPSLHMLADDPHRHFDPSYRPAIDFVSRRYFPILRFRRHVAPGMVIPKPDGALQAWVEQVLFRVWQDRQQEAITARHVKQNAQVAARKPRGRPRRYDKDKDAAIYSEWQKYRDSNSVATFREFCEAIGYTINTFRYSARDFDDIVEQVKKAVGRVRAELKKQKKS